MMYQLAHRQSNRVKGRVGYALYAHCLAHAMEARVRLWRLLIALFGGCLFLLGGVSNLQAQMNFSDVYFAATHVYGTKSGPDINVIIYRFDEINEVNVYYQITDSMGGVTDGYTYFSDRETQAPITITPDPNAIGTREFTITLTSVDQPFTIGMSSNLVVTILDDTDPAGLDMTFKPGTTANGFIRAIALQSDGRILIGGTFSNFNNYVNNYFTRLTPEGYVDTSLNVGSGANGMVNAITVEPSGKILVSGNFTSFNTSNRAHVVRLDASGALDVTLGFNTNINAACYAALGLPDGKTLVGGAFRASPKSGLVRLLLNGQPDISYDTGFGITNGTVYSMVLDGSHALIGGSFTTVDVVTRYRLARVDSYGQVDLNYEPPMIDGTIYAMAMQPDRKLIIAGSFTNILGQPYNRIARLNPDGTLDTTFASSSIPFGAIYAVGFQADGIIYAAGSFTNVNGSVRNRLARFLRDGTLDQGFDPGMGANHTIYALAVEPDGNVLIGGAFSTFSGVPVPGIARLKGTRPIYLSYSYDAVNNTLTLTSQCTPGRTYNLYYSEDMKTWNLLGAYNGSYTEPNTQTSSPRFYQVRCEP